jgi:hypothetical protein
MARTALNRENQPLGTDELVELENQPLGTDELVEFEK